MGFKESLRATLNKPEKGDKPQYFNMKGRISGYILTKAQQNIPTAGYNYEADVTALWETYRQMKNECDYAVSFNTIMMRILVEGLKAAPKLNSHISFNTTSSCGTLLIKEHIDVSMPVILENGETFTIKVKHTENKSLKELSEQIDDLMKRLKDTELDMAMYDVVKQRTIGLALKGAVIPTIAQTVTGYVGKHKVAKLSDRFRKKPDKSKVLGIDELNEGTVCLTNWGPLYEGLNGNVTFTPLLFPQAFLMAMGSVRDKEYVFKNEAGQVDIGTKKVLPITLLFDHRIGGFNDVMPFIKKLDEVFMNPEVIKNW